ncbi:tRNA 4-thiouridine(8) synthase ThiI [Gallaecimonas kandeliae]|uniref:tRNA uracil 4-sulfurtransferase ThiI n=1 Tax=Gallaecimonas kandeliae TaxID=3029055 RepID=UPI0026476878|nr:tRNA uracil 4-sulfurtransferase ThiI [Gallaecimonas kandeliae]WKE64903.1 tRNA 4-thiouridine(8) synthase ThiI [Gallaecimonas kandeliae]
MKFIIKLHPEITIKSKSVRLRFIKLLESNIRVALRRVEEEAKVDRFWDKLEVRVPDGADKAAVIDKLCCTPGVSHVLEVAEYPFQTLHDIYEVAQQAWGASLACKTFCVRVKRSGKHEFSSIEVERYVGGGLNQNNPTGGVRLKNPDLTLNIEIEGDRFYLVAGRHKGLGGFPIKTQEDLLTLISGGFDSGVASYQAIRRGSRTHYCFFNLGGSAHEIGTKQMAYHLWDRFGASHRVKFVTVPFEAVVAEILEKVEDGLMGVVLKRMMMRAAAKVAERMNIQALVTGEAVGQVSSQTLTNLTIIDRSVDTLILRPLIFMDKQEIVDCARDIGTFEIAETMPEFCGVISKSPNVRADIRKVEATELDFDMAVLDLALENAKVMDIRDIATEAQEKVVEVEAVAEVPSDGVILDIRAPDEEEESPLEVDGIEVKALPFYKLATQFGDLPKDRLYFLYCAKGVMSKLQALYLQEQGFSNVRVYRPH